MFENRVLKKIFEKTKCWELTGEWRKLQSDEVRNRNSSANIFRVMKLGRIRWAGHVARMRQRRVAYRALMKNHEGKRPLGRPRRRWEDNIKMDHKTICLGDVDWIYVYKGQVASLLEGGYIKCGEFPGVAEELSASQ